MPKCLKGLLWFNHIEEDDLFIAEISKIEICPETINISDWMLFNPFEVNEGHYYTPLYEIDPDINCYNSISYHLRTNCNYYYEYNFETALKTKCIDIKTRNGLSICQLNIRSIRANLSSFEICLNSMNYNFSVMRLTVTRLRDYKCNLYDIEKYTFTEVHRIERAGGGVGIFVKDDIPFQVRTDICGITNVYKCILWKLKKEYFHKEKNFFMGVIYWPPDIEMQIFNGNMSSLLNALKNENKYC